MTLETEDGAGRLPGLAIEVRTMNDAASTRVRRKSMPFLYNRADTTEGDDDDVNHNC